MAEYSRLLNLDADTKQKLITFLNDELIRARQERTEFMSDIVRAQKDYWAEPSTSVRTFPFRNAANIIIPIFAITFETVHARAMTTAFGIKQLVSAKPIDPMWSEVAPKIENFFDRELRSINFKSDIESAIIEIEKLGGGVSKTHYVKSIKYGIAEINGVEEEFPIITQGCKVDSVPLSRFLFPFETQNIQECQWVGEELDRTPHQIRMLEETGYFFEGTYETLKNYVEGQDQNAIATEARSNQESLEKRRPVLARRASFVEIYLSFDIDSTGRPKEIVVHYHEPTQTLMSVRYNNFPDLRRPYVTGRYFPLEHRLFGLGIWRQVKDFQKEITTQHRQRLDNATLANMRMIKISRASGYGPNEPVFPGKMWFLDDMTHVDSIQMGEVYPSSQSNEFATLQYAQQRGGANEIMLGMQQVGTPGTATSDMARIQEGNKKFDYVFGNIKEFVTSTIMNVASCIQKYGPRNLEIYQHIDGGEIVKQFFQLPESSIRDSLIFELSSAGQHGNKLLDRQNWQQIAQFLQQYYVGMAQMAQINPQLYQQVLMQIMRGSTEAAKRMLETYEIPNSDKLTLEAVINGLAAQGANGIPQNGLLPQTTPIAIQA